jgi:DsbC/DsbD-like thiol-disulfide interchange protein
MREFLHWRTAIALVAVGATFGWSFHVRAQEAAPQPVQWSAKFASSPSALHPGAKVTLNLTASIDSGWHVYAVSQPPDSPVIATDISVPAGQPLALSGDIAAPQAISRMDPTIGKQTDFYEHSAAFTLPLKVDKKARAGKHSFEVDVRFQACSDRLCLPPRTEKIETPVSIASGH